MGNYVWQHFHEWVGDTVYEGGNFYTRRKCLKCKWSGIMGRDAPPNQCEIGEFVPVSWLPAGQQYGPHRPPTKRQYRKLIAHVLGELRDGRAVIREMS